MKLILKIFFGLFLLPQLVFGASWYIDCSETSNGIGSEVDPSNSIQSAVDLATGGDSFNIANTTACVLTAPIDFSTGFTKDNSKTTVFKSWDNGGSILIQRPDEATGRIAATIDGNGAATNLFQYTSATPNNVVLYNLELTGATNQQFRQFNNNWNLIGCEIHDSGNTNALVRLNGNASLVNNYFHSTAGHAIDNNNNNANIINNWIEVGAGRTGILLPIGRANFRVLRNFVKISGSNSRGIYVGDDTNIIMNNTVVSTDNAANQKGIEMAATFATLNIVINNVIYNIKGSGAIPFEVGTNDAQILHGYNSYYDSNAKVSAISIPFWFAALSVETTVLFIIMFVSSPT